METKDFQNTDEYGQSNKTLDELLEGVSEFDDLYTVLFEMAKTDPFQARIAIERKLEHDEYVKWQDFNKFMTIQELRWKATHRYNRTILTFFSVASGFIVLLYATPYLSSFARACTLNSTSPIEFNKGAY